MNGISWLLLLGGVALNAAAQLLLKAATRQTGPLVTDRGTVLWESAGTLLQAMPLWFGLSCYAVSVLLWLGALSRVPVSIAYPMLSIGYVANAIAASYLFSESLTLPKLLGIGLIVAGVFLLSRMSAP